MSLTSALNTAQSIFNNTGTQSSVVSNNIANAGNTNYNRREAVVSTTSAGATVVQIARSQDASLQTQFLSSTSDDAAQQRLLKGLEDIKATMGGNDYETSPATYLATLQTALQTYAGSPSSLTAAQGAVTAAQDVATSLNQSTQAVQSLREDADKEISTDVDSLNNLLAQFKQANDAVQSATVAAASASGAASPALSDALDQRDAVLGQISQLVGIKTVTRDNNDMAIYTSTGTVLFETLPRTVTFQPTNGYTAGTTGNSIYIDGVPLASGQGSDTNGQGSLQSLIQLRDDVAPTYQKQLDEIARGLVTMFSETTTDGGTPPTTLSTQPGLFVWTQNSAGDGETPTSATVIDGMAGTIAVSAQVVTSQGGDPTRLRDGTINPLSTSQNPTGDSGYSTLLDSYSNGMDADMSFDPSTGVDTSSSILSFASNSVGWVEGQRSSANTAAENTSAALTRSSDAYSNSTGVNLDEELTLMMDIEQSYKAGTKLLSAVNDMLQALLDSAS
ncbi:flagellar hook-associated protein FlgK [Neorhizobium sp. P12A]|uniref:flagellar hook-associated protein FlgK n=1 Tax=Neorhizobium sp. P12A TaxID=2268027 RepID=UPI0011ECB6B0|nr:flagellar hook-associated protein FlgK [Neorhizobium sp. P12A]KAA0699525.1 flagellar hook-associated protein FlgK [Neorhizobium sp. P12A]